jgi:hypothetical protein
VVFNYRQREPIRSSVKEYYDRQHFGPRRATWAGLCDEIFEYRDVQVRPEVLRQWATGFIQKGRNEPLRPNDQELDAIAEFLMSSDVGMLAPEDLEDPEPPRFLSLFLEFLSSSPRTSPSQATINGSYEAWYREDTDDEDEEKWIKINIGLRVDPHRQVIQATETMEIHFRGDGKSDVFVGNKPSEGWGIVTPEQNLFLFMKTPPDASNHYYFTMAVNPDLSTHRMLLHLGLLRHENPARCDPTTKSLEELIKGTNGRTTVLTFKKK